MVVPSPYLRRSISPDSKIEAIQRVGRVLRTYVLPFLRVDYRSAR
jgi:superfamily II DNA or RNA helicase